MQTELWPRKGHHVSVPYVSPQAVLITNKRPGWGDSLNKWREAGKGKLLQHLLGLSITQRIIHRKDPIKLDGEGPVICTYEVLEGKP